MSAEEKTGDESYSDSFTEYSEEDYALPEDLVSQVPPAKYLKNIYQLPVILFEEMGHRVPEFIRSSKYDEIPDYNGVPITDSIRMFVNAFNALSRKDMRNPPRNIADYAEYITSLIPQKAAFQIANSWPPAIPRITNPMEPLTAILIKALGDVEDPINLMNFLSLMIFPKIWTTKPSAVNSVLLALSPCKYRKKEGFWALIVRAQNKDDHDMFYLITKDKKTNEPVVKIEGEVTRCAKSKDKLSVIIKNESGRVADFQPLDDRHVPLWTHLYKQEDGEEEDADEDNKKPRIVPFPYFLTDDFDEFIPDQCYPAFYEAITSNDSVFLHALMNQKSLRYSAVDAFLTITLHNRKITPVYGEVISFILQPDNINPMAIYSGKNDSFYRKFIHALFERFAAPYLTDFLRRIVLLIDQTEDIQEKTFFSVIKYITMSSQYIPLQLRHFAAILRSYSVAKYNSRGFAYILLGGFFGLDFICPVLANVAKYFPDVPVKHPEVIKKYSDLLQYVFHGSVLPEPYKPWNKRLIKHVFPLLEEFLFSLGDLTSDVPPYPTPAQDTIAPAILKVMHALLYDDPTILRKTFDEDNIPYPTLIPQVGWSFAVAIGDFFRQYFDRGQKRLNKPKAKKVRPKDLQFPKLPMYGMVTTKKAGINGSVASSYGDSASVSSLQLPFRERNLTAPPPSSIRLPMKPKNPYHNPLQKPERDNDSDESSLSEHPRQGTKNRSLPLEAFTPPPTPPPEPKKRHLVPFNYSATETITEDTTDDQPDPELQRGTEAPSFYEEDGGAIGSNRKKRKVSKRIVIKSSGIAASNEELVKEEVFNDQDQEGGRVRTKIRTLRGQKNSRGTGNRENDSI